MTASAHVNETHLAAGVGGGYSVVSNVLMYCTTQELFDRPQQKQHYTSHGAARSLCPVDKAVYRHLHWFCYDFDAYCDRGSPLFISGVPLFGRLRHVLLDPKTDVEELKSLRGMKKSHGLGTQ